MDYSRNNDLLQETAYSVFIPKIAESKKVIQEINGYPTYADKIKTLSLSNRILDGSPIKNTTSRKASEQYTIPSRLYPHNLNKNPNTIRANPILMNETINEKIYKNSRKPKHNNAKEQPMMNITSVWRDSGFLSPQNK